MKLFIISGISIFLFACVSAEKARFYHPEHGVVDGNNQQLKHDSLICASGIQTSGEPETSLIESGVAANKIGEQIGEKTIGNVAVAAGVVIIAYKSYRLINGHSKCMVDKGWSIVELIDR